MDPRIKNGKGILNTRVKNREWFRPFAPSCIDVDEYYHLPPSWYMSYSCEAPKGWKENVPSVVHVDGSCRPHVVSYRSNPALYWILALWNEATGMPFLLNTSLNINTPILCDRQI